MTAEASSFATEQALVSAFCTSAAKDGWRAYGETSGWDVLLVRDADGFQIGIEAKLRLNVEVLVQVLKHDWSYMAGVEGPDSRAVLVPRDKAQLGLSYIAERLGITIIRMDSFVDGRHIRRPDFQPWLPKPDDIYWRDEWPDRCPDRRHKLPDYVPDVVGGAPSPFSLTAWKIKALKIVAILDSRGFVLRSDFKALSLDHRRWFDSGWLKSDGDGRWLEGERMPRFRDQHPANFAEIAGTLAGWLPAEIEARDRFATLTEPAA